ncbi:MAG: aminomethyltransferase family protein [Alphaproteobacteria bacterium]
MIVPTEFVALTDAPPYSTGEMRLKGGLKRTSFHPVIGRFARQYKLHNSYLKPDVISDPLKEYWATRTVAALWDVTGEEVIEVAGPDALTVMDELVPRDLTRLKDGRCRYAIMCYEHGGIVEDGVVVRFGPERLWWVGGPAHAEAWIYAHAVGRDVRVTSFLDDIHVASIQGPKSRAILQRVAGDDVSRVPYFGVAATTVCGVPVVVTRTGYTGELGFDIYVDVARAVTMFEGLWQAGRADGLELAGSQALNLRRVEAAILNVGYDFDWRHNPYEVGLGWMIDPAKRVFVGRAALARIAAAGVTRRIAGLRLAGTTVAHQGDWVVTGGRRVGRVTSAVWGPTVAASIAMAFVETAATPLGVRLDIEHEGATLAAEVVALPFLDPERKLSRA